MCKVFCDNMFCIYWSNDQCVLEELRLDAIGVCAQSIHVDIDERILEKKRAEMLRKFYKSE